MSTASNKETQSDGILPKYIFICVGWVALVGGSLEWNLYELKQDAMRTATSVARTVLEKDIAFRDWASSHGGVYVPPTAEVPPNPYLKVPDRDVVTTTGKVLTLMNPAYIMRDVQQNYYKSSGIRSHLTSLKLLNPGNAPDAWERSALLGFDRGDKEALKVSDIDGKPHLRLMLPFPVTEGCLKCHGMQGYKVGDIRGGIGAYIPMQPYLDEELAHQKELTLWHGVIFLVGLLGMGFAFRYEQSTSARLRAELYRVSQAEESLNKAQRLLNESEQIGKVGGWEIDIDTGKLIWTEEVYHIHELAVDYDLNVEKGVNFYTPASRPIIEQAVRRAIEQGEPFDLELEITTARGNLRSVHAMGKADLKQRRVYGFFQDITERKRAEESLKAALEFNSNLINSMQDGFSVLDTKGIHMDVNPALCRMTGFSHEELIGAGTPHPYWPPEEHENINAAFQKTLQGKVGDFELIFMHKNGERFPVIVSPFLVIDEKGNVVSYTATVKNIAERKKRETMLTEQLAELRRWQETTVGREMRAVELKREVNELLVKAGQPVRYPSAEEGLAIQGSENS